MTRRKPAPKDLTGIRQRGSTYQVRISGGYDPVTGRQLFLTGSADTEDAAIVLRDGLRRQVQDATAARTNVTLGYVLDEWLSGHQVEETTRATYRLLINGFIRPALGDTPMSRLCRLGPRPFEQLYAELRVCRRRCHGRTFEELLVERGIMVDHVTVYRWVQRFTPLLVDAARPCRHAPGDRWFVDETYVKVAGRWVYLYRAIDQYGQVIDVLVAQNRDLTATRRFLTRALEHGPRPAEVSTDRAPAYPRVVDELLPSACHVTEQYANNPIEADHGRLKSRLRPMRGLKRLRSARVISTGHAFVQNLRRGHYELGLDTDPQHRLPAIFTELARAI